MSGHEDEAEDFPRPMKPSEIRRKYKYTYRDRLNSGINTSGRLHEFDPDYFREHEEIQYVNFNWRDIYDENYFDEYGILNYLKSVDECIVDSMEKCNKSIEYFYEIVAEKSGTSTTLHNSLMKPKKEIVRLRPLIRYLESIFKHLHQEKRKITWTFENHIQTIGVICESIRYNTIVFENLEKCSKDLMKGVAFFEKEKSDINKIIAALKKSKKAIDSKTGKIIHFRKKEIFVHPKDRYGYRELKRELQEKINTLCSGIYSYHLSDGTLKSAIKLFPECCRKTGEKTPKSKMRYTAVAFDELYNYLRDRIPASALVEYFKFGSDDTFRKRLKEIYEKCVSSDDGLCKQCSFMCNTEKGVRCDLIPYLHEYYSSKIDKKRGRGMYFTQAMVDDIYNILNPRNHDIENVAEKHAEAQINSSKRKVRKRVKKNFPDDER